LRRKDGFSSMSEKTSGPEKRNTPEADTETSRVVIVRVKPATHMALRIRVAEQDTSIQDWVVSLIERELGISRTEGRSGKTKEG
jgi:predicted HicB family RNase H-like nuclease